MTTFVFLMNDGPFVFVKLCQLLFPSQDIYETVLHTHLQKVNCDNDYYKYT